MAHFLHQLDPEAQAAGKIAAAAHDLQVYTEKLSGAKLPIVSDDQAPPAGQNVYHFCDAQVDAAERVALGSYDLAIRKRAYDGIQRRLVDEEPTIIMWFVRRIDVVNSDMRNFKPAHAVTDFWNSWEWSI